MRASRSDHIKFLCQRRLARTPDADRYIVKQFALKLGLWFGVVGAIVTLFVTITATWDFGWDQHGTLATLYFVFAMTVIAPSVIVGRALGIQEGTNAWLWNWLAVILNTLICIALGAALSVAARLCRLAAKNPEK